MKLHIRYETIFSYDEPVRESHNEVRACPVSDTRQQLLEYSLISTPSANVLSYTDYWGTKVDAFGVSDEHDLLSIVTEARVETKTIPVLCVTPDLSSVATEKIINRFAEYLAPSRHTEWGTLVTDHSQSAVTNKPDNLVEIVRGISFLVGELLGYERGSTEIGQPIEDILRAGRGVCQDYAHLAVALCRSANIPARYVSGYLFASDDASGEISSDKVSVQTHAWFEAYIPGYGWLPLDPTNRISVGHQHVKIGHGRDYDDVPPLRGTYSGAGRPTVKVSVDIERLDETSGHVAEVSSSSALDLRSQSQQ